MSIIKNIFFIVLYVLILIYLLIFIPSIFGYKPLVVISGSMEPTLKVGGLLYYHEINPNDFKKDDIIVYNSKDHIISHRLVEKTNTGFITKGDANNVIDSNEINENQVLGKGTNWCVPLLGYYGDFIYHHKYLLYTSIGILIIDLGLDYYKVKKEKRKLTNEKNC